MKEKALVGVVMGSHSDWEIMQHGVDKLDELAIPNEVRVMSAHRTPEVAFEYAATAVERGLEVIIAGAGMAAALPGVLAAKTPIPIIGVPIKSSALEGMDALFSMVQMPPGIPVATVAIGRAGAINAAVLSASILGLKYPEIRRALEDARKAQSEAVLARPDPRTG